MEKIAILMADLSGYTAWTAVHGPEAAASLIETYITLVTKSLAGNSSMLERIGDQIVVTSPCADDIAQTAINLYRNAENQQHFLPVHAGVHYGDVLKHKENLYGSTINLCSRLAARAREGKVLCSSDFVFALKDRRQYHLVVKGKIQFKNVFDSIDVMELNADHSTRESAKCTDPVCHMQIEVTEKHYRYKRQNKVHHFCSIQCMNLFQEFMGQNSFVYR